MNWLHTVVLGIVEGLTEFLPVSSTGHLLLTARILGLPQTDYMKTFEIAIQLGAILAVVMVYWRRFLLDMRTLRRVFAAFLPTAVIGLLLYKTIKHFLLNSYSIVLWALGIGGVILILFDQWAREKQDPIRTTSEVPFSKAFGIGVVQSLSVVPGVSRSAATIVGGMFFGLDRRTAVEFSFLLAVPTVLAATVLELVHNAGAFDEAGWKLLFLGGSVAFLVAIVSIRLFIRYVQKNLLTLFGVYRIAVAVLFWALVK